MENLSTVLPHLSNGKKKRVGSEMSHKIRGFETSHIFHSPYYYFFYYLNISYIFRALPFGDRKKQDRNAGKDKP